MEDLNIVVGANLKKIRNDRKLSLDRVSDLTGISKSMLGQIERCESNPSITTVWKIAHGLRIQFSTLLETQRGDIIFVNQEDISPLIEDSGKFRVYPLFPYNDKQPFEVYTLEIEKGGYSSSSAHVDGTQEFITIFEGELNIRVNNDEYYLRKGNSICFSADKPHSYHNSGNALTKLNMILSYTVR